MARRSSFRAAGEELHLTQPAISRQIRSLEEELGATLFLRGTRHVELTSAGAALLRSVAPWLDRLDASVRQIRSQNARQRITVTTFASFASLWLIPRLQDFQRQHPGVDIRVSPPTPLPTPTTPRSTSRCATRMPTRCPPARCRCSTNCSHPWSARRCATAWAVAGVPPTWRSRRCWKKTDDRPSAEYLSWRHWLRLHAPAGAGASRLDLPELHLPADQAALAGQGVALARVALVHETLKRGELVEPFGPDGRVASPFGYWLVRWEGRAPAPHLQAFEAWVLQQAAETRAPSTAGDEGRPPGRRDARPYGRQPSGHCATVTATMTFAPPSRSRPRHRFVLLLIAGLVGVWAPGVPAQVGNDSIVDAREALRKKDKARLASLRNSVVGARHALAMWPDYWELGNRLAEAQQPEIDAFYERWAGTYVEDRLRNDWLLELGRRRDWANFSRDHARYRMQDDREVACYALLTQHLAGQDVKAAALSAWYAQRDLDDGCHLLASTLAGAGKIDADDIWRELRLSVEANRPRAARAASTLLGPAVAKLVGEVLDQPARFLKHRSPGPRQPAQGAGGAGPHPPGRR